MRALKVYIAAFTLGPAGFLGACNGSSNRLQAQTVESVVEHGGAQVSFVVNCHEGAVRLAGSFINKSNRNMTAASGTLPWEVDILGTAFAAASVTGNLSKRSDNAILGRAGPINLQPGQRLEGMVELGTLFPDLREALERGPVEVTWKYDPGLDRAARGASTFEGVLRLPKGECIE